MSSNLVRQFWDLPSSERRRICEEMGLLRDADYQLPEQQRYLIAFEVCGTLGAGAVRQLREKVEQATKAQ